MNCFINPSKVSRNSTTFRKRKWALRDKENEIAKILTNPNESHALFYGTEIECEELKHDCSILHNVLRTIPNNKPKENSFQFTNSFCHISMVSNPKFGLPYGKFARLLLAATINEVTTTNSPVLQVAKIYSKLKRDLDFQKCAGTEKCLYDQMLRLFSTNIIYSYATISEQYKKKFGSSLNFWWNPLKGNKENITSSSTIILNKTVFDELINFYISDSAVNNTKNKRRNCREKIKKPLL